MRRLGLVIAAAVCTLTTAMGAAAASAPNTVRSQAAAMHDHSPIGNALRARAADVCRVRNQHNSLGEGFPLSTEALPSTGHLNAAEIFVDFSDHPAPAGTLDAAKANLKPGIQYLTALSRGALAISVRSSATWIRMPEPSTDYPFARGITTADHLRYITDAITAADPTFNFRGINVVWVVATKAAPDISYSPTTNYLDVTADGQHLGHAVTFGYDQWYWGGLILAHETSHTLGLPDLYLFDPPAGMSSNAAVGGWDLMGLINGPAPELLAWQRWELGWLNDSEIACLSRPPAGGSTAVTLTAVERGQGTAMAMVRIDDHRILVIESRRALRYDRALSSPGALVYVVDTAVASGDGPIHILDATPGSPRGLDDATLRPGSSITDPLSGLRVSLLRSTSATDVIRVSTATVGGPL